MNDDTEELRLALTRLKAWCEGRSQSVRTSDVRRVIQSLIVRNRLLQVYLNEVGAWRKWHDGTGTILAFDGTKRRSQDDWDELLKAREASREFEVMDDAEDERPEPTIIQGESDGIPGA